MYSRPKKASHLDTIAYEIDMLKFCLETLRNKQQNREQGEENLLIEGFLLHYRNLIRVFSGRYARPDDLSTNNVFTWAQRELTQRERDAIQKAGEQLDDMYFRLISVYLQHCTEQRFEFYRQWDLEHMYAEIEPLVTAFEASFLPTRAARKVTAVIGGVSNRTDTPGRSRF